MRPKTDFEKFLDIFNEFDNVPIDKMTDEELGLFGQLLFAKARSKGVSFEDVCGQLKELIQVRRNHDQC